MTSPRLLLDISTLLRHWGRADGITRTLSKLAAYALDHIPNVSFVYLNGSDLLEVKREYVRALLSGKCRIDISHFPDPGADTRIRERVPRVFSRALFWIQRPRRQALILLDRLFPQTPHRTPIFGLLRQILLNNKYRQMLTAPDGSAVRVIPHDLALSTMQSPARNDILILAGSDWNLMSMTVRRLRPQPRVAAFCYDIVPLLFPQFFTDKSVLAFRTCVETVFAQATLVFFSARKIAVDTEQYWLSRNLAAPPVAILALGTDVSAKSGEMAVLPAPLIGGRFALFVSTIEPRKNHRLLFEVWKQLLNDHVPQNAGFCLAFVGRKGWMIDELWAEMTSHPSFDKSLIVLTDVDDATLNRLYEECAFTVYPSLYEGFGLPVIESFEHGKAIIASSAGALPETVGGLSPCLDPSDVQLWCSTLKQWIIDPAQYEAHEREIKRRFAARPWDVVASDFFAKLDTLVPSNTP